MPVNRIDPIKKYDQASPVWWTLNMVSRPDGKLTVAETGLTFGKPNPSHPFVRDVQSADPRKAQQAIRALEPEALAAYLWNAQPAFVSAFMGNNPRAAVSPSAAGVNYGSANALSAFVKSLDAMSDADFAAVTRVCSTDTTKAYLFSKYPQFFQAWDSGTKNKSCLDKLFLSDKSPAMDGTIGDAEWVAAGGPQQFLWDIRDWASRDRTLLVSRPLLYGPNSPDPKLQSYTYQHVHLAASVAEVNSGQLDVVEPTSSRGDNKYV